MDAVKVACCRRDNSSQSHRLRGIACCRRVPSDVVDQYACSLSMQKAACTVDNLVPVVNGLEFILAFGIQKLYEDCAPAVAPPGSK